VEKVNTHLNAKNAQMSFLGGIVVKTPQTPPKNEHDKNLIPDDSALLFHALQKPFYS